MPHFHDYAVAVTKPGYVQSEAMRVRGTFLRDVMKLNLDKQNLRVFGPDETASDRLEAVFEVCGKERMADIEDVDINLSTDGRIDDVANKKSNVVRIYLPADPNCLLSVADHCLRSRNCINLMVAGKQPEWQWLDLASAVRHCTISAGIWHWAGNETSQPDVVMACAGDVPRLETLAVVTHRREYLPDIRIRVVIVVDLMVLQPQSEHPHGMEYHDFDELLTTNTPVIFGFHGYLAMIHKLTYRHHSHHNIHMRSFKEEGTTTTPFDMDVLPNLDRYQLVAFDAIQRSPRFSGEVEEARAHYWTIMERHRLYISEHGEDMPEVCDWRWKS